MDQVWANRAASAEAADRQAAPEEALGAAGHAARRGGLAAAAKDRRFGTWHYWWQAHLLDCLVDAQVRDPQARAATRSPARSAGIGCATTDPGSTTTTTTWRGWRWRWSGRAGWPASRGPRRWRSSPSSSSTRGCPRTAAASRGASRTSSSTPRQRAGRHLPGPLRRPAAAGPADGRLDRRDADRPGDPPGVRRHQGRFAGARAVHLLPGRGAGLGDRARRAHRGRPSTPSACTGWSQRSPSTWLPTG